MNQNLLEEYTHFVDRVTSQASKSSDKMKERVNELSSNDIEVSRLLTAGIGLSGEVGEFNEIIKKIEASPGSGGKGYRIISNAGEHGFQDVPHLHFHIVSGRFLGPMILKK